MHRIVPSLLALAALTLASPGRAEELKSEDEKTQYALGALLGRNIEPFSLSPAELEVVKRGFVDAATGKKLAVKVEDYQKQVSALAQTRIAASSEKHKKTGAEYVEKAAKEKGAEKSATGLVYIPEKEGTGASPKATDTVKANYSGTLIDGTVFDASAKHGGPAEFPLGNVIPCWTEGLQKMKVGGKAKLVCPASIAYGDRSPPGIPPGSTLIFDVELVSISAPAAAPAAPATPATPASPAKPATPAE